MFYRVGCFLHIKADTDELSDNFLSLQWEAL